MNPVPTRPRILLVEDDPAQRESLSVLLQDEGFDVTACPTARAGLEAVGDHDPFDAGVFDLRLPDMEGTQLLEQVRLIDRRLPVILNSGYGSFQSAKNALNSGAFAFVEKLGDPDELLRYIHRAVGERLRAYSAELEEAVERRTAALRASESHWRAVYDGVPDALILVRDSGEIEAINPAGEQMFGQTSAWLVGQPLTILLPQWTNLATPKAEPRLLSEGGQTALRCDGSEFPAEIRQQQLKDLANRRLVIVRDISQLLALQRQLLQSQKMESLGRMAASVAHDFNTLLTVMTSACAQMHSSISPSNPARESLTLMEQATQRATSLARQLLTFGRRQPTKPRLMNLNETILGLVPILHRLLPENVRFSQDLADGLPAIRIDPSQLEQVLLNLISNARDAMPEGGGLTLKTYQASLPRISGSQEIGDQAGDYVILTVKDSGAGMDEATRSRVFEPFFTTKPEGKGTGLGLATVYGHVRLAGGRIEIDSTAGLGTEIRVALPAVASHEHACPLDAHGRGETVLVVEDDEPVRGLIKLILEAKGFHVLTTGDLNATTKLLQSHVGPIDLLITDMFLPSGVGTQVAEIARDIHPQLRVLVISGYGLEAVSRQDVVPPPSAYLAKPFAATTLVRCVRALLDQPL